MSTSTKHERSACLSNIPAPANQSAADKIEKAERGIIRFLACDYTAELLAQHLHYREPGPAANQSAALEVSPAPSSPPETHDDRKDASSGEDQGA